jgi:hypothetical protein
MATDAPKHAIDIATFQRMTKIFVEALQAANTKIGQECSSSVEVTQDDRLMALSTAIEQELNVSRGKSYVLFYIYFF